MTASSLRTRDVSFQIDRKFLRGQQFATLLYLHLHRPGFRERISHALGHAAIAVARSIKVLDRLVIGERLVHGLLGGMSQDRIRVLGQEYATEILAPALCDSDCDAWRALRAAGWRIRLVSGYIEEVVSALCATRGLQVDELVCNRLEYREHVATGRLLSPLVSTPSEAWQSKGGHRIGIRNLEGDI